MIGYDDIEAADYVGLTTVRQQLFESGRRGAEILLAEIVSAPPNHRRRASSGARDPSDDGATEGGPWMKASAQSTGRGPDMVQRSMEEEHR